MGHSTDWGTYAAMQQLLARSLPPHTSSPSTSALDMIALPNRKSLDQLSSLAQGVTTSVHQSQLSQLQSPFQMGHPTVTRAMEIPSFVAASSGHSLTIPGNHSTSPSPAHSPLHHRLSPSLQAVSSKLSPSLQTSHPAVSHPAVSHPSGDTVASRPPPIRIPANITQMAQEMSGTPSTPLSPYTGQQGGWDGLKLFWLAWLNFFFFFLTPPVPL